jgi:two-component system chemotaxis sensor kinase CheA
MSYSTDQEVLASFADETRERTAAIEAALIKLENRDAVDPDLVNHMFRQAHSIKATANLLEFGEIERLAKKLENTLEGLRQGHLAPSEATISGLLADIDAIRARAQGIGT